MENNPVINNLEKEDDFDISQIFFKYLSWLPLFITLTIFSIITAALYLRYKIPVYQITASILVKDEKKGIDENSIMEALDMFGSKKIVENEIEVLKSRSLMQQVVNNLQLYAPVWSEGRVKDVSAYINSPVHVEAKHPDSIATYTKVYFTYDSVNKKVIIGKSAYPVYQWFVYSKDTLRFIPNNRYTPPLLKRQLYFSTLSLREAAAGLLEVIEIIPVSKQATVISMSLKDEVQNRGEDILNELIRVYNQAAVEDKNILARNTLAFVEDRLRSITGELEQVEGSIQKFKSSKGIVDISSQGQLFLQSVQTNDQKIAEMNLQLAVLDQVEKYVVSKGNNAGIVPSTLGVTDPVLSQLLQTLAELQLQIERLKKTTGENNPITISLQNQIEKVKPGILENIRNQRNNLFAGRNNLTNNSNRFNSLLRTVPENERQLLDISRQQVIKNNIYTFLLQKREETALSFASTVSDSRTLDTAEASILPISPKKAIVYLIAVIVGLALSISIINLNEFLNQNILFRSEIEKWVSWPVVGEIVYDSTSEKIAVGEGKRTAISEQFRQLRTSLDYLGINEIKKKILITSSISGEGKSFISVNLAMSLAVTGKKVVLIELDLRKPKLSGLFDIKAGSTGITNFFIGKATMEDIVRKNVINNNLYFIPSGPIPPNPSELLLNGKLEVLFANLEKEFDYIVIDTAPVAPVTDAHILSKFCDATLYIIRHNYTPKIQVKRLEENNKIRGLKNVAIIFNGLKGRGFSKYGYGYGYGYEYSENN